MTAIHPASVASSVRPVQIDGRRVLLLDQTKLPDTAEYVDASTLDGMCDAIKRMVVRGAPAIGVAAALGLASEAIRLADLGTQQDEFLRLLLLAKTQLQETRPTAVNLRWGTEKIYSLAQE